MNQELIPCVHLLEHYIRIDKPISLDDFGSFSYRANISKAIHDSTLQIQYGQKQINIPNERKEALDFLCKYSQNKDLQSFAENFTLMCDKINQGIIPTPKEKRTVGRPFSHPRNNVYDQLK